MLKKKIKVLFITALATLFLSGCSLIQIQKNDTSEFLTKQIARNLGYKMSERKPDMICKAKELCTEFSVDVADGVYDEDAASAFAKNAISWLASQIHSEDRMLMLSLNDLIAYVNLDMSNIKVNDDNVELLLIAVGAYLEGVNMVAEDNSIICE